MATAKNTRKKTTNGTVKDGVYTEDGVILGNGNEIEVGVIMDKEMLPASTSSLAAEGNFEGLVLAQLTVATRRVLDWTGATRKDLHEVIAPVIERANEMDS